MCLAIPGRITDLDADRRHAIVDVAHVKRRVNVDLLRDQPLDTGDWVLIHVGFAMSKISAAQADEQMQLLDMLGEADEAMEEFAGYAFAEEDDAGGGDGAAPASGEETLDDVMPAFMRPGAANPAEAAAPEVGGDGAPA